MLLVDALSELETLKGKFKDIQSKYNYVYEGDGCEVYFGSQMWADEVVYYNWDVYKNTDVLPLGSTKESVLKDIQSASEIIKEVDDLFKKYNLSQFLAEQTPVFWLGLVPESISSLY